MLVLVGSQVAVPVGSGDPAVYQEVIAGDEATVCAHDERGEVGHLVGRSAWPAAEISIMWR